MSIQVELLYDCDLIIHMQESQMLFLSPVEVPEGYPQVGILSAAAYDDYIFLNLFYSFLPTSLDPLLLY